MQTTSGSGRVGDVRRLVLHGDVPSRWATLAQTAQVWLQQQGVAPRDAVVLLPFAQHLSLARAAFAALGGWPPRLHTTRSLAASLAPPPLAQPGQLSGDAASDHLAAVLRLRRAAWADAASLPYAAGELLALARALRQAADACAPAQRAAYWAQAAALLPQRPEGEERQLGLLALAWAREGPEPASDALFDHPAGAWVLIEAGGADLLARERLACGDAPALCLQTEPEAGTRAPPGWCQQTLPDDASLAQATAAQVLSAVHAGATPVLLPAIDRALLRRVLGLLAPYGLSLRDETGASLATLAPAAALRALLQACQTGDMDELLTWARSPLAPPDLVGLDALEAGARRHRRNEWRGAAPAQGAAAWLALAQAAAPLREGPARRPLKDWLAALRATLAACRADADRWREADRPAWQTLGEALWLSRSPWPGSAAQALMSVPLGGGDWLAWVDQAMAGATVAAPEAGAPQVVVTPLARALLRPFAALVLAGCDEARWPPPPALPAGLAPSLGAALGLGTREQTQQAQDQALAHLLALPRAVWLHAAQTQGVAQAWALPLLRLRAGWGGAALPEAPEARVPRQVAAQPSARQQVQAAGWVPAQLSATQVEALRACPYQFWARVRLGLREPEEIDRDLHEGDLGHWLHALLQHLHAQDDASLRADFDGAWERARDAVLAQAAWPPGAEAPWLALLARWQRWYKDWDAAQTGRQVRSRERELRAPLWPDDPLLGALHGVGRLDRLDDTAQGTVLLDYKTTALATLKARSDDDPQLPFYALLLARGGEAPAAAAYLAPNSSKDRLEELACEALPERVEQLAQGLAHDLRALHGGEPLRALGEGKACEHCSARGLCRRDDAA